MSTENRPHSESDVVRYMAPELLSRTTRHDAWFLEVAYGTEVDLWAVGEFDHAQKTGSFTKFARCAHVHTCRGCCAVL